MVQAGGDAAGELVELRGRVLTAALTVAAVAMPLLGGIIVVRALVEGRLNALAAWLGAYTLCFPLLRLAAPRLPLRVKGGVFLLLLLLTSFIVQLRGGIAMASSVLQLLVIVLGGLLYGRRGVALTLTADLLCFALAGVLLVGGHAPPVVEAMWDPGSSAVWLRAGVVLAFFGAVTGMAVAYVVDRLEQEARMLRGALQREKAQHAQVVRAQVALAEAQRLEAIGRLASGVAHDFNNALTVVLGASELALQSASLPEQARSSLRLIEETSSKAAELTRSLLLLGRKDAAQPRVVSAQQVLGKLAQAAERLLPSDVELAVRAGSDVYVEIDPTQLERVLLNLVVNARDAVEGGGRIELGCERRQLPDGSSEPRDLTAGAYVMLWVSDDGVGMDEEVRRRVFEPFFTTKPGERGTGMGMALAASLVEQAGGKVALESAPGEGTTVTVYLPQAPAPEAPESVPPPRGSATRGHGTLLVVEDEPSVRQAMVAILRRAGFETLEAADGDRALALVEDEAVRIDLLCLDGVIPGAPSGRVIESMRARRPHTPILICSGYVDEDLLRRGIRTGELACVHKPFSAAQLLDSIHQELGHQAVSGRVDSR